MQLTGKALERRESAPHPDCHSHFLIFGGELAASSLAHAEFVSIWYQWMEAIFAHIQKKFLSVIAVAALSCATVKKKLLKRSHLVNWFFFLFKRNCLQFNSISLRKRLLLTWYNYEGLLNTFSILIVAKLFWLKDFKWNLYVGLF